MGEVGLPASPFPAHSKIMSAFSPGVGSHAYSVQKSITYRTEFIGRNFKSPLPLPLKDALGMFPSAQPLPMAPLVGT